jgi:hypothetical protein
MIGQVVGSLGQPGAGDEGEPRVLQGVQARRREHPGVGDHDHLGDVVTLLERGQYRDQRGGLGLVALEQVHFQRESTGVCEQPDLHLRVDAVFLAHPDLAQLVLAGALEVQRGDVVEHQGAGAAVAARRAGGAGSRSLRSSTPPCAGTAVAMWRPA